MESRRLIEKNKFLYLFLSLSLFFLLNPLFAGTRVGAYIFGLLFTVVLIFSVYILEHSKWLIIVGTSLALLAIAGHWITSIIYPDKEILLLDYLITILFFVTITVVVLSYVIRDKVITTSTLFGAICGYLLIGLTWCFVYLLIYGIQADAFLVAKESFANPDVKMQYFIYYSFVTISTLGYGDITPVTNVAKTFSWMEAILGQIYLTVWIAQLVGLHVARKQREN